MATRADEADRQGKLPIEDMDALKRSGMEHAWAEGDEEDQEFDELVAKLARGFAVSRQAMTVRLSSLFA